jgi:hypothetical protein
VLTVLRRNGKIFMSDGKVVQAAETSMAGVVGYRKLGGRLGGIVAYVATSISRKGCLLTDHTPRLKSAIRSNTQRATRFLQAAGVSRQQMRLGSTIFAALAFIWLALRGWIPGIAYMAIGALLWKSVSSAQRKTINRARVRKDGETCSTAVFLGSGEFTSSRSESICLKYVA